MCFDWCLSLREPGILSTVFGFWTSCQEQQFFAKVITSSYLVCFFLLIMYQPLKLNLMKLIYKVCFFLLFCQTMDTLLPEDVDMCPLLKAFKVTCRCLLFIHLDGCHGQSYHITFFYKHNHTTKYYKNLILNIMITSVVFFSLNRYR